MSGVSPAMADGMVDLFYSYSHKDEDLREQLDGHLALLRRRGVLRVWHDRKISAGGEWKSEIASELERADIVLLLISADFLASDYCYDVEMKRALARHAAREASVIPVILRACDGLDDAPFAHLQALPKDRRPVTSWANRDEAWVDVVKGIRQSVAELPARPAGAPVADHEDECASTPAAERDAPATASGRGNGSGRPADGQPEDPPPAHPGAGSPLGWKPRMPESRAGHAGVEIEGRGSLVMRILRKLGGGLAKGVVVGGPDVDVLDESRPAPAARAPHVEPPRAAPVPAPEPADFEVRSVSAPDGAARERRESELVQRVLSDFGGRMQAAYAGRNAADRYAPDAAAAAGEALVAIRDQKRILWVDDAPAGNAQEVSALLGLQIDVRQVTSTQAALDELAAAGPAFDLVISDWNRVPRVEPLTPEGVRLLRLMRRAGHATPLIFYHGELDEKRARGRAQQARREGAFGATSMPGELFTLVRAALAKQGGAAS